MRATVAGALAAVLLTGALVMDRTRAAFVADTANPASDWAAGTVEISDDDSGTALFSVSGLLPGDSGEQCIVVTYVGTLSAAVRLYAGSVTGSLGPYLALDVEEATVGGNVGSFSGGCGAFSGTSIYSGTVAGLSASAYDFDHGVGTFAPASSGEYRVYRFSYTLDAATPDTQQGAGADTTITWEARNT
jgi:hypothetical protein